MPSLRNLQLRAGFQQNSAITRHRGQLIPSRSQQSRRPCIGRDAAPRPWETAGRLPQRQKNL